MESNTCHFCNISYKVKGPATISTHNRLCLHYQNAKDALLTEAFLKKEYSEKGKSAKQISEDTKIGVNPVISKLKKYGIIVRSIKQSNNMSLYKARKKETCVKKYGAENTFCKNTPTYRKKQDTVLSKYGVTNVRKFPDVIEKIRQKLFEWRDINGHSMSGKRHSKETRRKQRIASIRYIKKQRGGFIPRYNKNSISIIEKYGRDNGYNFQHAENGGEVQILGYYVDGYDRNQNTVIEVDEKHHYRKGKLKKKDVKRQKEIEEYLKCTFIRIDYEDYINKNIK